MLVGALFISIGLFCSSLTRSQIVAAVATAAMLFAITIVPWWVSGKLLSPDLDERDQSDRFQTLHRFQPGDYRLRASGVFHSFDGGVFVSDDQSSGIAKMEMSE